MAQAHVNANKTDQVNANKTDQKSVSGLFFKDRLATSEIKAVLDAQDDADAKKRIRYAFVPSLNRPKLASTCEQWLKTLKLAFQMGDCVDRDLIINACNKAGQYWENIARLVIPQLNMLEHREHHVHDGLGWKALIKKNSKKRSHDDDNDNDRLQRW